MSTSGIVVTGLISIGVVIYERGPLGKEIRENVDQQGKNECAKIAKDVYLMLQMEEETEKKKISDDIKVASLMLEQAGGVSFEEEKIKWNAVNQLTKESRPVELPKMLVGSDWLGQNTDLKTPSPLVDKVHEVAGDVCTVFQRLNDAGDMLRVCTNVPNKANGTRAIGTYIS
jgi:methyl-accepting chemotaxis protein